jgi:para-aminobenzoate synthetase component 1
MKLSIKQFSTLKLKVLDLIKDEQVACVFDSNMQQAAFDLCDYEWIAGWGAKDATLLTHESKALKVWQRFMQTHKKQWKLGYLTYEIKNQIEALSSTHFDGLGWPELHFFVPQQLIVITKGLCVVEGRDLVTALLEHAPVQDWTILPQVSFLHRVNKAQYMDCVNNIKQHIKDGDVYEMNYCMELYAEATGLSPEQVFQRLKNVSPVPFACYYKYHHLSLMCASPERFLLKRNDRVYSQPIKGTAPRGKNLLEDIETKQALRASEKEQAENLMIVDLVRNDLARTAKTGTVRVEELFGIYSFKQVHQMISTVSAQLDEDTNIVDLIKYAFPMGSMTGAPKIKSMELIERYEATKRGLYSGCVGYIMPNGDFDFNVVIRALQYNANSHYLSMMVGSAITFDSEPELEYSECLLKASAMLKVFDESGLYQ